MAFSLKALGEKLVDAAECLEEGNDLLEASLLEALCAQLRNQMTILSLNKELLAVQKNLKSFRQKSLGKARRHFDEQTRLLDEIKKAREDEDPVLVGTFLKVLGEAEKALKNLEEFRTKILSTGVIELAGGPSEHAEEPLIYSTLLALENANHRLVTLGKQSQTGFFSQRERIKAHFKKCEDVKNAFKRDIEIVADPRT
jgi:hypothetical protein